MIRHVIIWNFKEELTDSEKTAYAAEIKEKLEALKGVVPGLEEIVVRTGLLGSSNGDIMLDSMFESEEALSGYQTHPEHLKAAALVRSVTAHRSCADFEV